MAKSATKDSAAAVNSAPKEAPYAVAVRSVVEGAVCPLTIRAAGAVWRRRSVPKVRSAAATLVSIFTATTATAAAVV